MKKSTGLFSVLAIAILAYLFFANYQPKFSHSPVDVAQTLDNMSKPTLAANISEKKYANQEIEKLALIKQQCKHDNANFTGNVQHIHQGIIRALEHELTQGVSTRELLAYASQYQTFYKSFNELLHTAKVNIERNKYQFAVSPNILNQWQGLEVIDNFSPENITAIVAELEKLFKQDVTGLKIPLRLNAQTSKWMVYQLLENENNFNTYFTSPLTIKNSRVISPSILFAINGQALTLNEFSQAVSGKTFSVNEVAAAIEHNMANEYINVLLQHVVSLDDMPIFVQNRTNTYENLADLAVSKHNVELLQILETYGVIPTNEPGIITGLDIAIMNLPQKAKDYKNVAPFPNKYANTITYLLQNGYHAHGTINNESKGRVVVFKAPNYRPFLSSNANNPKLQTILQSIALISDNANLEPIQQSGSKVANAIAAFKRQRSELTSNAKVCRTIKQKIDQAENFAGTAKAYKIIDDLVKNEGGDISSTLQSIDPVLVHLWQTKQSRLHSKYNGNKSKFLEMIRTHQYQNALEYSFFNPLTQKETDRLLLALLTDIDNLMPVWQSRMSAKKPSSLWVFASLPVEQWQHLYDEGFDFTQTDLQGNDMFLPAMMNSTDTVDFLLEKDIYTNVDKPGLDVLDLVLEDSYERGKLNKNVFTILEKVPTLEPNHYARIARLKHYFPNEYDQLVAKNIRLIPPQNTQINQYRFEPY